MNPSSNEHERVHSYGNYISSPPSSPQRLQPQLSDVEENSLSSVSMGSSLEFDAIISKSQRTRERKQLMKSVSIDDVMTELSDLRAFTEKLEGEHQQYCEDFSWTTSVTMPSEIDEKDTSALPPILQADTYQALFGAMVELGKALDSLQMELIKEQAEVLRFRMSVVQTMMDFSSLSKKIRSDIAPTKPGERLTSSCSDIPDDPDGREREVPTTSSFSGGYDRLLLDIHPILEEAPGEGISDSSGSSPSLSSAPNSLVSSNQLPFHPVSEPDNGRLSRQPSIRRRSYLERVEEPLSPDSQMTALRKSSGNIDASSFPVFDELDKDHPSDLESFLL